MFFKALFNGIGSGGGVAWSLFGIILAALGVASGGLISIVLGINAIVLFLAIATTIFYFSYQKLTAKEQKFQAQNTEATNNLFSDLANLELLQEKFLAKNLHFKEYCSHPLINFSSPYKEKEVLIKIKAAVAKKPIPFYKLFEPAFTGFIGSLGSQVGCCAGFFGMLTGVALFAGFTIFPILAWSLVALCLVSASIFTYFIIKEEKFKIQRKAELTMLKDLHEELGQKIAKAKAVLEPSLAPKNEFQAPAPFFAEAPLPDAQEEAKPSISLSPPII